MVTKLHIEDSEKKWLAHFAKLEYLQKNSNFIFFLSSVFFSSIFYLSFKYDIHVTITILNDVLF